MKNTADEILRMIEAADPKDGAAMDEIDLAVSRYLHDPHVRPAIVDAVNALAGGATKYSRSRDALKSIRPKGYCWKIYVYPRGQCRCDATLWENTGIMEKTYAAISHAPTEELAELSAIIQAIQHDRSKA